jgi:uncharacterized protein YlzI (FlbEa/FlbD family)
MIGVIGLTFNKKQREAIQKQNKFIGDFVPKDTSTAAKALDISIIVFAMYSIFRGIFLLKLFDHESFKTMMQARYLAYILYGVMGAFLVVFYYIVSYTSMNIDKDAGETGTYKLIGLGTGMFFLISLTGMYVVHNYKTFSITQYVAVGMAVIALMSGMAFVIKENIDRIKQRKHEIITILMIPLGGA